MTEIDTFVNKCCKRIENSDGPWCPFEAGELSKLYSYAGYPHQAKAYSLLPTWEIITCHVPTIRVICQMAKEKTELVL